MSKTPAYRSRDLLLQIAHFFDKTAFRCMHCGRIARGIAPRVVGGWTCSNHCWDSWNEYIDHIKDQAVRRERMINAFEHGKTVRQ